VSSLGAQVSTPTRFAVASISIHTLNGSQIPISVLIVPKLTAPVRNSIHTHLDQFPYLQQLTLAHPITSDENFHVSILIDADYFWQFIQDHVVHSNGPTAVQSRSNYSTLLRMYNAIIKDQETRGFIERVSDDFERGSVHYIPHHPIRKESLTTLICIVFDCSCKSSADSPSSND